MANIKADEISKILREQIEKYDQTVAVEEVGAIISVGDGSRASMVWKKPCRARCWRFPTVYSGLL